SPAPPHGHARRTRRLVDDRKQTHHDERDRQRAQRLYSAKKERAGHERAARGRDERGDPSRLLAQERDARQNLGQPEDDDRAPGHAKALEQGDDASVRGGLDDAARGGEEKSQTTIGNEEVRHGESGSKRT